MKRILRISLLTVSIIALLLIAITLALTTYIDPETYKEQASQRISRIINKPFIIHGDMHWGLSPEPAIKMYDVEIQNEPGSSQPTFAKIKECHVHIKLLPLLRKRFVFDEIELVEPELYLVQKDIPEDFDELLPLIDKVDESEPSEKKFIASFAISEIEIKRGLIHWKPSADEAPIEISDFDLDADDIRPRSSVKLFMDGLIKRSDAYSSRFKTTGNLTFDKNFENLSIKHFKLSNHFILRGKTQNKFYTDIESNLKFNFPNRNLILTDLEGHIANLFFDGNLKITSMNEIGNISGNLNIPSFNLRKWIEMTQVVNVNNLPYNALRSAETSFTLSGNYDSVKIDDFRATIDKNHVTGSLIYNPYTQQSIADLLIDRLPLTNYLPTKNQTNRKSINLTRTNFKANLITSGKLTNWKGTWTASIRGFNAGDFKANSINLNATMANGFINLSPLTGNLYKGTYRGNSRLNLNRKIPTLSGSHTLRNIDTNQLLNDAKTLTGLQYSGTGEAQAQLTFAVADKKTFLRSLNGTANLKVTNGVLKGIDVGYYMSLANALFTNSQSSKTDAHQTPFNSTTATVNFVNGVVKNEDLLLISSDIKVEGSGEADLVNRMLDYTLIANRARITSVNPLSLDNIPIRIVGPFDDLRISADMPAILRKGIFDTLKGKPILRPLKRLIPRSTPKEESPQ